MDYQEIKYVEANIDKYFVESCFDIFKKYKSDYEAGRILLHGSDCVVTGPRADKNTKELLDFGEGFYTTTFPEQAKQWAIRRQKENYTDNSFVSVYLFHPERMITQQFDDTDVGWGDWLDFVSECRTVGRYTHNDVDLIVGHVADDDVVDTVDRYIRFEISKQKAIEALKFVDDNDQYVFIKNEACERGLDFIGWYYAR